MTDEIKEMQDAMKGQGKGLPPGFAVTDMGSRMLISRAGGAEKREYVCPLFAYGEVCEALRVFCGPAPAPGGENAAAGLEMAENTRICTQCHTKHADDDTIQCTECKSWFCDNCYDTELGDGCKCHAMPDTGSTPPQLELREHGKVPEPIYDVNNPPKYEVRNVKFHQGMEGQGFNLDLYRDGVFIAHVLDEGCGGSPMFYFEMGPDKHRYGGAEMKLFDNFCLNQPPLAPSPGMEEFGPFPMNMELYLEELLQRYEEIKFLQKHCKGKTLFRLKDTKRDQWLTLHTIFSEEIESKLKEKYGDQLVEIANKRPELFQDKKKKTTRRKK